MKVFYEKKTEPISVQKDRTLSSIPHLHNEIEIIYVAQGEACAYADHSISQLKTGDVFIAFPNQIHYYGNCTNGVYFVYILSPELIYGLKTQLDSFIPEKNTITAAAQQKSLLHHIDESYRNKRFTECAGYFNLFMAGIMDELPLTQVISSDHSTLRGILNYCAEHFTEEISLSTAADELHLNKFYISHLVNRKLNVGFSDYVTMLRVRAACDLLRESDKKIADISEDVGFGTIRSLNRSFRQVMKTTPLEYRNLHRNQSDFK